MDDAKKSATRFYMNTFQDKGKQEIIDQLLGKANQSPVVLHDPVRESVEKNLATRRAEWCSWTNIIVQVCSWNVNGKPPLGESLISWLSFSDNRTPPDVFAIGFQEIVELSPQQIMATDITKRLVWEDLVLRTLNSHYAGNEFVMLKSAQLVGAALMIFVKSKCTPNIRNVQTSIKKTGLAGLAGNKGGVAIAFDFFDTSLCFVCSHLAAGHSNYEDRNKDFQVINDGLAFAKGRWLSDFDRVIWFGDFNYRIEMENAVVRNSIRNRAFAELLQHDQVNMKYDIIV
jgi:hypothetical protein